MTSILVQAAVVGEAGETYLAACGKPVSWIALATQACELTGTELPAPVPLPDDPNLRMFYSEAKRCRPTRLGELDVTLRYPDTLDALTQIAKGI